VSNAYLEKVAIAAFSTGQVALSKEILAYLTSLNGAASSALAQVERFWEDDLRGPLCLAKLVDAGSTQRSADVIRSNIAIEGDDTAIQFPVSRFESGRGVITFRLDLTDFTSFSSSLRTRGPEGQQLWFYAGLTSLNGQGKIGFEGTAAGRSETRVDFTLPEELRRPCTFDLIVERRGEVVSGAEVTAIWRNPQFRRGTADQYSHRHLQ
jgi:hypothetical protein